MTARAYAGWDYARVGPLQCNITDTGGATPITISTGTLAQVDLSPVLGSGQFTEAADNLETALNASALNGTFTVTFSTTTLKMTISSTESFTINSSNTVFQRVTGITTFPAGVTSKESDRQCWYVIGCNLSTRGGPDVDTTEPDDVAVDAVAGAGSHYGLARADVETWRNWTVLHEPVASVMEADAPAGAPFTWESLVKHARNTMPVAFVDTIGSTVGYLRAESTSWSKVRKPVRDGYRGQWDIVLMTRELGTL